MFSLPQLTLSRQFMLVSFLILLSGMLIIGIFLTQQIEMRVINQTTAVTALYVDSFVSPRLQGLEENSVLEIQQIIELDQLLLETPLGQQIVAFKVWSPEGQIIYSQNRDLIGRRYTIDENLASAFAGHVESEISELDKPEHESESRYWDRLIETYAPVRADSSGEVIAVSEFYRLPDELIADVEVARIQSWVVVAVSTLIMYWLLTGLVGRASKTILKQQDELRDKVTQLSEILAQNRQLHSRVRRAAGRTTALNERFLRRISSDLHDGPAQDLSLALLRIDALAEACVKCEVLVAEGRPVAEDFEIMENALKSSMKEIRTISAGLRLPELETFSPAEVAARAIRDYKRKTNRPVKLDDDHAPEAAPEPVKITLYRMVQEALVNGFRHAGGDGQSVRIWAEAGDLQIEIADTGKGFDSQTVLGERHLGLVGMRERVEVLGGTFSVNTSPGGGTHVHAIIPLDLVEYAQAMEDG
ncbi:MAG: sensor histidine kinase [Chloroflexi bacterium]|nr:sensor histidine kinase [Chloroflexota bacterium]